MDKLPIFLFLLLVACGEKSKSINVYSRDIKDKTEKLAILKKYLSHDAGLLDAEYHIAYHDNGGGLVPGPSDYTITVALKIIPDSLDAWTKGLERLDKSISPAHWNAIVLDSSNWSLKSVPEIYTNEENTTIKLVYPHEGIVLAAYSTSRLGWKD